MIMDEIRFDTKHIESCNPAMILLSFEKSGDFYNVFFCVCAFFRPCDVDLFFLFLGVFLLTK